MPENISFLIAVGIITAGFVSGAGILGWIHTTRLKIKNGYPLESMWGRPMHPQVTSEAQERISLLTQENAGLRAEIGSLKDRLGVVERIVTDSGYRLGHEIDLLREGKEKVQ